jgi:cell division protein FtsI (penicillin-binding protein 3)
VFFLLCALGLVARLVFLQVYQHEELTARARQQQVRRLQTFAPRRTISDRHGTVLAVDQAVYTVYAHPHLSNKALRQSPSRSLPFCNAP